MSDKLNSGTQGAGNSSNKIMIEAPMSDLYLKSRYIAAVDQHIGLRGALLPTRVEHQGLEIGFDFYYPERNILVKVFTTLEPTEIERYAKLPDKDILFIIDANNITDPCPKCGRFHIDNIHDGVLDVTQKLRAFVYLNESFWVPDEDHKSNEIWGRWSSVEYEYGYDDGYQDGFRSGHKVE